MKWNGLVAALFGLLILSGCATTDVFTGATLSPKDQGDLLVQLANNPLIAAAVADAADTTAWVNEQEKAGMDPVKVVLARACPTAVQFAAKDLHDKLLAFKAALEAAAAAPLGTLGGPHLILNLTKLKYGPQVTSPQVTVAQMRQDLELRLDALWTGCSHLFPKKEAIDLFNQANGLGFLNSGTPGLLKLSP